MNTKIKKTSNNKFTIYLNHKEVELNRNTAIIFFGLLLKKIDNKKLYLAILGRLFDKDNKRVDASLPKDLNIDLFQYSEKAIYIFKNIEFISDDELDELNTFISLIETYVTLTKIWINSSIDNYPLFKVDLYNLIMDSLKVDCVDEIIDSKDYVTIKSTRPIN